METIKAKTNVVFSVLALAFLVIFSISGYAGKLEPSGPPGPTMKTLDEVEPRTPVQSLPGDANSLYVISQPGSYYLTSNITGVAGKNGIEIASDNVTVDLKGFALIGMSGSLDGLTSVATHYNIAVVNGTIRDWGGEGVDCSNARNSQFANLRVYGNTVAGVLAGQGSTVSYCTARDNGTFGIGTNSGTAINCTAYSNSGFGIFADNGSTVVNCTARSNGRDGIGLSTGGGTIEGCTARFNSGKGISAASGCTISNCAAEFNTGHGFALASGSSVKGCTARSNSGNGFNTAEGCTVTGNTVSDSNDGIYTGDRCVVTGNTAHDNNSIGIRTGRGSVVKDNTSAANGSTGILVLRSCTVTGNAVHNNNGIGISTTWFCTVTGNTAYENDDTGISVKDGCTVTGNTSNENRGNRETTFGHGIETGDECLVIGNNCGRNNGDGIKVRYNCRITDNTCIGNGSFPGDGAGIHATWTVNYIQGNHVLYNRRGIEVDMGLNIIVKNSASGNVNNLDYDIAPANKVGAITSDPATAGPWDNFK